MSNTYITDEQTIQAGNVSYLGNAFSLQMLNGDSAQINAIRISESIFKQEMQKEVVSCIGHQETADILHVECKRTSIKLQTGDILLVAQLCGGRLDVGATELPEGYYFQYYKITLNKPFLDDFISNLIKECSIAEHNYYKAKMERVSKENELILSTDWNFINEVRKNDGLGKISNQASRDAYIAELIHELKQNELYKLCEWNNKKMLIQANLKGE